MAYLFVFSFSIFSLNASATLHVNKRDSSKPTTSSRNAAEPRSVIFFNGKRFDCRKIAKLPPKIKHLCKMKGDGSTSSDLNSSQASISNEQRQLGTGKTLNKLSSVQPTLDRANYSLNKVSLDQESQRPRQRGDSRNQLRTLQPNNQPTISHSKDSYLNGSINSRNSNNRISSYGNPDSTKELTAETNNPDIRDFDQKEISKALASGDPAMRAGGLVTPNNAECPFKNQASMTSNSNENIAGIKPTPVESRSGNGYL